MDIILNRYNFSPSFSSIETFESLRAQTQTSVYNRSRDYLLRILLYPSYFKLSPNISTNNPESRDPFTLLRTRITSVRNERSCCANLQLYYFFFFFKNNNAMRISCTRRGFIFQLSSSPRLISFTINQCILGCNASRKNNCRWEIGEGSKIRKEKKKKLVETGTAQWRHGSADYDDRQDSFEKGGSKQGSRDHASKGNSVISTLCV